MANIYEEYSGSLREYMDNNGINKRTYLRMLPREDVQKINEAQASAELNLQYRRSISGPNEGIDDRDVNVILEKALTSLFSSRAVEIESLKDLSNVELNPWDKLRARVGKLLGNNSLEDKLKEKSRDRQYSKYLPGELDGAIGDVIQKRKDAEDAIEKEALLAEYGIPEMREALRIEPETLVTENVIPESDQLAIPDMLDIQEPLQAPVESGEIEFE